MIVSFVDGNDSKQEDIPSPRVIANNVDFIMMFVAQ